MRFARLIQMNALTRIMFGSVVANIKVVTSTFTDRATRLGFSKQKSGHEAMLSCGRRLPFLGHRSSNGLAAPESCLTYAIGGSCYTARSPVSSRLSERCLNLTYDDGHM